MRRQIGTIWLGVSLAVAPPGAFAQENGGGDEPFFTARDALWAGGFALGTVAMAPVDIRIAEAVRDSALQEDYRLRGVARGLDLLGFPGAFLVGFGLYGGGRLAGAEHLAEIGLRTSEALFLGSAVTFTTKALAGRARPWRDVENPFNFGFGRGFTSDAYQSFPSGHTTAAFAVASAITAQLAEERASAEVPVGLALYGAATLIGISRLYHNMHWASDVVMGAAIGSFAGWKVVSYGERNPDNRVDRWLLGISIEPGEAGRVARLWVAPAW